MVNAQEWLDQNYPKERKCAIKGNRNFGKTRRGITRLDISKQNLAGTLDLTSFSNLMVLSCYKNQLTNLDVSKNVELKELSCSENQLTSVEFLKALPHPEKLESLYIYNNNIQLTDIACFSKFTNLKRLKIGTTKNALAAGKHNKFSGSLQAYQNLTKLASICIEATDVDRGLEYLPASLATAIQQEERKEIKYLKIECSPHNLPNAGCKAIQDQLRPLNYNLAAWQLSHFDLVLSVNPENLWELKPGFFTEKEKNEKLIAALITKISQGQEELNLLADDRTKERTRLETKLTELGKTKSQLETRLNQENQKHRNHLQKLFSLLDTTTGSRNFDRFNDNDVIYNRVKEKIQTQQRENRQALENYQRQISELEEIINSFQNQIEKVNRENLDWEEKFEKLSDDYVDMRAVAGGLKLANNTLKNEWRKTEQELKAKREERQNNLNLFVTILNKQKELKILEDLLKRKLENQSLLESLLTSQELLTNSQLTNTPERVIKLITLQLTQIKSELAVKITSEEINQLCQVKHQLAKLELELEKLLPVNLEAKIEIR